MRYCATLKLHTTSSELSGANVWRVCFCAAIASTCWLIGAFFHWINSSVRYTLTGAQLPAADWQQHRNLSDSPDPRQITLWANISVFLYIRDWFLTALVGKVLLRALFSCRIIAMVHYSQNWPSCKSAPNSLSRILASALCILLAKQRRTINYFGVRRQFTWVSLTRSSARAEKNS